MYRATGTLTKVQVGGTAGFAAGMFVTVVVWILQRFVNVEVPADIAAALTGLMTLLFAVIGAYLTPLLPGEIERVLDADAETPIASTQQPSRPVAGVSGGAMLASPDQRATAPAPDIAALEADVRAALARLERAKVRVRGEQA